MRGNTGRRNTGSFASALLLGLVFGVALVVGKELIYQARLLAQYEDYAQMAGSQFVTIAPQPDPTDVAQTGSPAWYRYTEGSDDVSIQLGDDEITIDFNALRESNSEFVAWFVIPGTDMSYPVVQGADNSFYLKHLFDGTYSSLGTLFVDYRNTLPGDENIIIYGHNFHQYGSMLSQLVYYAQQTYYEEHPVIYLLTEEGGYTLEVFSAYEASTSDPVYTLSFSTWEEYALLLTHVTQQSAIQTEVAVSADDKVITLSTCSNLSSQGRFVVVGKLTPF